MTGRICKTLFIRIGAASYSEGAIVKRHTNYPRRFIAARHLILQSGPLARTYSTTAGKQETGEKGGKWNFTWSTRTEWKIFGTVVLAAVSWYINARQDRKQVQHELQLRLVTNQLKELYGPLYGNRIVTEACYRAAMQEHGGLKKYLKKAQDTRNGEMIKVWRAYVVNVLYPLDKQALELMVNRAHLIADKDFPEEFDTFLEHTARMQFLMEHWKNDKGKLESVAEFNDVDYLENTNSSGLGGNRKMIAHLRERCRNLRQKQQKFTEDLNVETLHNELLNRIVKGKFK